MEIEVKGKMKEVEMLCDGVARTTSKSGNHSYYIKCNVLGTWDFRHQQAFDGLMKKYGSIEEIAHNTISNAGKKHLKGEPVNEIQVETKSDSSADIEVDKGKPVFGKTYWSAPGPIGTTVKVEYD